MDSSEKKRHYEEQLLFMKTSGLFNTSTTAFDHLGRVLHESIYRPSLIPTRDEQMVQLEQERDRFRRLAAKSETLCFQLKAEIRSLSARPVVSVPGFERQLEGRLSSLIRQFHPDRNGGKADATEVTAALNQLRDQARGRR